MNFKSRKKFKKKVPFKNKNALVWVFVFIAFSINVFYAVQTSSMGTDISFFEDKLNELEKQNEELSVRLINSTSLLKLNQSSDDLGFKKIENTLYIEQADSFAKAQ